MVRGLSLLEILTTLIKDRQGLHTETLGRIKSIFQRERTTLLLSQILRPTKFVYLELHLIKKGTTLITERGYLKVVKSFNDELSWKVQDALVDAYFAVKNQQPTTAIEEKPVLPIETDWFCINRWKINFICGVYKLSTREYMHSLLLQIGKTYNFDNAKQEFMRCTGRLPKSNSEVITYFQELADTATKILNDDIEHYKEMWKKENDPD